MNEQPPGTFRDEDGSLTDMQSRGLSIEERYKKKAAAILASLTPDRVAAALPSEHLRQAFARIESATGTIANLATLRKREAIINIRERSLINETITKSAPLVYLGAGTDIEYPLTLGAREIVMVDPIFTEQRFIDSVKGRIGAIAGEVRVAADGALQFQFDFGNGPEPVIVRLCASAYGESGQIAGSSVKAFEPPEKIGMFLTFQGPDATSDKESFERLVEGGYVLSNAPLSYMGEAFSESETLHERYGANAGERRGIIDGIYRARGLESLHLFENDPSQTFVRKVRQ